MGRNGKVAAVSPPPPRANAESALSLIHSMLPRGSHLTINRRGTPLLPPDRGSASNPNQYSPATLRVILRQHASYLAIAQPPYVLGTRITLIGTCVATTAHTISGSPMERVIKNIPRVAIFLVGMAAGALASGRRERGGDRAVGELRESLAGLEGRLAAHESAIGSRLGQIETRIEEHSAKLAEVPSTEQIVAAMEQLLSRTMSSLDERLVTQAHSIDVLKTTVSQTDDLLERVLESIDALQTYPPETPRETPLPQSAT